MKYGDAYRVIQLAPAAMNIVRSAISKSDLEMKEAGTNNNPESPARSSQIAWLYDNDLGQMLFDVAKQINELSGWNLSIKGLEPVQFGIYPEGGHYGWHVDQHKRPDPKMNGMVRKISLTVFLNEPEEYEGGEFDIEIYKPEAETRFSTIKESKGSAVFFQGDQWHRVRPVTSGFRKSLVAWFYGPPYL